MHTESDETEQGPGSIPRGHHGVVQSTQLFPSKYAPLTQSKLHSLDHVNRPFGTASHSTHTASEVELHTCSTLPAEQFRTEHRLHVSSRA